MANLEDVTRNNIRLRQQSEKLRAEAIRTRIQAAHAFCSVAESKLRLALPGGVENILTTVRKRIAELDFHLREPGHLSPESVGDLRRMLDQLDARKRRIEKSMKAKG
jgi:hypothetical protein